MVHEITCRDEHVTNRRPGKKTLHPFHWAKFAFGRKLISPKKAFDQKLLAAKLQAKNIIRYDFVKLSRAGRKTPIGLSKFFGKKNTGPWTIFIIFLFQNFYQKISLKFFKEFSTKTARLAKKTPIDRSDYGRKRQKCTGGYTVL